MLKEFSSTMSNILGSNCRLEIDVGAMEQILAAAWASDSEKRPVRTWLDQVFASSLEQKPSLALIMETTDLHGYGWLEPIVPVQVLSNSGVSTVPQQYIRPPSEQPIIVSTNDTNLTIPIIDLCGFDDYP
ncbi:hypothetical protein PR202_gb00769 [Eleusine coracana subsp. coracana]|uniref:SMAX1-like AAA+ ATPase lid domain-containing protein n=1 Tax=Eleusine coracana subsp. coracana TaxID=191504 RepID=A0AAV5DUS8_ELECO|nr:hypothetical protein PR202_gb00769 [Eleusine coracana subsp. coracana]